MTAASHLEPNTTDWASQRRNEAVHVTAVSLASADVTDEAGGGPGEEDTPGVWLDGGDISGELMKPAVARQGLHDTTLSSTRLVFTSLVAPAQTTGVHLCFNLPPLYERLRGR